MNICIHFVPEVAKVILFR